jgi:hypothetical protein
MLRLMVIGWGQITTPLTSILVVGEVGAEVAIPQYNDRKSD